MDEAQAFDAENDLGAIETRVAKLRSLLAAGRLSDQQAQRALRIGFSVLDIAFMHRPVGGSAPFPTSSPAPGVGTTSTGVRTPVTVNVACPICTNNVSVTLS